MTLARAATDTFSGIRPADVPAFVAAQLLAAAAAAAWFRWLDAEPIRRARDVALAARRREEAR